MRRVWLAAVVAAAALMVAPTGASAATTTLGQLASSPAANCGNPAAFDALQASVTSGTPYVVPADGTITSWSHNAVAGSGHELKFKVFRRLAENVYQVVAHDGERDLTEGALNTFNVSIAVRAGDVIGLNDGEDNTACRFGAAGETGLRNLMGDLADGDSGTFSPGPNRLNLSAVLTTPNPLTSANTCKGRPATILGTDGPNVITGTEGPDVISAADGNDKVLGLKGKDVVCGGSGKDTLKGGKGKDKLYGQKGKDKLRGGGGKDRCVGGKKDDTAIKCEVEKSI